jgi:hypothetical protein
MKITAAHPDSCLPKLVHNLMVRVGPSSTPLMPVMTQHERAPRVAHVWDAAREVFHDSMPHTGHANGPLTRPIFKHWALLGPPVVPAVTHYVRPIMQHMFGKPPGKGCPSGMPNTCCTSGPLTQPMIKDWTLLETPVVHVLTKHPSPSRCKCLECRLGGVCRKHAKHRLHTPPSHAAESRTLLGHLCYCPDPTCKASHVTHVWYAA